MVNCYIIGNPQPSDISYFFNFGSLLAFCLGIQIVIGLTLIVYLDPTVLE